MTTSYKIIRTKTSTIITNKLDFKAKFYIIEDII